MIMAAVPMPVMHEKVHQRASSDQQPGQRAEDVRGVFGEKEEAGDPQEADGNDPGRGAPPGLFLLLSLHRGQARQANQL